MAVKNAEQRGKRVPDPSKLKHGDAIVIVSRHPQKGEIATGTVEGFPWTSDETGDLMIRLNHIRYRTEKTSDLSLHETLVYYLLN